MSREKRIMANSIRTKRLSAPVPPTTDHLWTCDDVAAYAKLGRGTVRNMVSRGELPAPIRIGRSVRWKPSVIIAWFDSLASAVAA